MWAPDYRSEDGRNRARVFFLLIFLKCNALLGSQVSEGKIILIIGNNKKTTINGKDIKVTGQKKRIQEIVELALGKGFEISEKSIKHYAKEKGVEYVLIRLK